MYDPENTQGKNVLALKNKDFLCLSTMTGRGILMVDPKIPRKILSLDESFESIGLILTGLLQRSTVIPIEEIGSMAKFFNSGELNKSGQIWEDEIYKKFSYKTKTAMYKSMISCGVKELHGEITFTPSNTNAIASFTGIKDVEKIAIASSSSAEDIGKALWKSFSLCRIEIS